MPRGLKSHVGKKKKTSKQTNIATNGTNTSSEIVWRTSITQSKVWGWVGPHTHILLKSLYLRAQMSERD